MIKLLKLLIGAKAQSEAAYAAFLSVAGSSILFGTVGLLLLRYLQARNEEEANYSFSALEKQRDGIEAALIGGGVITRADISEHGVLVALQKALDAKKPSAIA